MKKTSCSKRILSFVLTVLVLVSCVLTAYAGTLSSFTGDSSGKSQVKIATNGGNLHYNLGGRTGSSTSGITASFVIGAKCTVSVDDTTTRKFICWCDDCTGRIISYDRTLEFTVGSRVNYYALCARVSDTEHFVSYVSYGGTPMLTDYMYTHGTAVAAPIDTKVPGFTFKGWSMSESEVQNTTEDVVVYPEYTVNDETYTVAITNDSYVSGAGTYKNFQTVNLKAEEKDGSGKAFSYWKNENDEVVSYERNYSFRINYNTTLTAVYGEEVTPVPVIRTSKIFRDPEDLKITFYAERSVPESYTVVSHGILISSLDGVMESQMTLKGNGSSDSSSASVRRTYGKSNENCGTFSIAKAKISRANTVTARPFMICQDAAGKQTLVYGDIVKASNGDQI